jgi:hypothetical protein
MFLAGFSLWFFVKIAILILLALYLVFALVVVRQTLLMTSTLKLGFETPIKILSYLHLGFAVFVFLTAMIIL